MAKEVTSEYALAVEICGCATREQRKGDIEAIIRYRDASTGALQVGLAAMQAEKAKSDDALALVSNQLTDATEVCRELRARIAMLEDALEILLAAASHGGPRADDRVKQWVSAILTARTALANARAVMGDVE